MGAGQGKSFFFSQSQWHSNGERWGSGGKGRQGMHEMPAGRTPRLASGARHTAHLGATKLGRFLGSPRRPARPAPQVQAAAGMRSLAV